MDTVEHDQNHRIRIGAVSYLNTKPLVQYLPPLLGDQGELSLDLPSHLAENLAIHALDVGLIPVVEFFRGPESEFGLLQRSGSGLTGDSLNGLADIDSINPYRIISDACIACRGPVRSVRLFFRVPPQQVRTLAIDEGSRTSVALSQVLLFEKYGLKPSLVPLPIHSDPDLAEADAVLVIGDRAMHPLRFKTFVSDWDLGQQWYATTGLPFVFAAWVARSDMQQNPLVAILEQARDQGLRNIHAIAKKYASTYALSVEECLQYLTVNLRFVLGRDELKGLQLFYTKAEQLGLVDSKVQPHWPELCLL